MPALGRRYRVVAVDLRGMGESAKPADGYDKKTMARDVHDGGAGSPGHNRPGNRLTAP
jgi:pimeloyl-ACP methyl ester carboxylesterase